MSANSVVIVGNLTRDPELKFAEGSGDAVVRVGIAHNKKITPKEGEAYDKTMYLDCEAWRGFAENIDRSLKTGDRVIVCGDLELDTWEDSEGNKRSKHKLVIEAIGPDLRFATATPEKTGNGAVPVGVGAGSDTAQGSGDEPGF